MLNAEFTSTWISSFKVFGQKRPTSNLDFFMVPGEILSGLLVEVILVYVIFNVDLIKKYLHVFGCNYCRLIFLFLGFG